MLTPLDFHYLLKELKIIEGSILKNIYKSDDYIFEFKPRKGRFHLVVGKNFCYLDNEKLKETGANGFANFLSNNIKGKKLIGVNQKGFNKVIVLDFTDHSLVLEFIGKGNIILCHNNEIVGCLFQREFKDRKILLREKYKLPAGSDNELPSESHIGNIYKKEIPEGKTIDSLLNLKPEPAIYFKENKRFFVSPFELNALADLKFEKKENFSNAIRDFFSEKKKTKAEIIQESREKNLDKYLVEEKKFKEQADLFFQNRDLMEKAIKEFKEKKKIIKPITEVLEKKGVITLELSGEKFSINMNSRLKNEINRMYEKSKKAGRKIEKIQKLFLEKINVKEKTENRNKEKKEWYDQFRYFHTSDGFLVIAGKDADTNEKLIKKYCKKNDIVLHAHIPGSPFGIIRSESREITKEAKNEAAQFVACYSKFWILKLGLADIYWITPEQVTKKVPGHQTIKKGSFMIYGKRNFLRVELRFSIGLDDKFRIVKGPLESVKKQAKYFITLTPGGKEGKEFADEIKSKLEKQAGKEDKEKIKNINPDGFLKIVPYGKGEFFEK